MRAFVCVCIGKSMCMSLCMCACELVCDVMRLSYSAPACVCVCVRWSECACRSYCRWNLKVYLIIRTLSDNAERKDYKWYIYTNKK